MWETRSFVDGRIEHGVQNKSERMIEDMAGDLDEPGGNGAGDRIPGLPPEDLSRRGALAVIFLVSLAGLVLEVAYTRVISYKLWYYYTYLVIGLALLGIGSGATVVAVSSRIRSGSTRTLLRWSALWGAVSIVVGYLVIARIPLDTVSLWEYGTRRSAKSLVALAVICFALFATFVAIGVIVSVLLGRGGDQVGRLYFADLIGAGLGCAVVVFLISWMGPPATIMLAATLLAGVGVACTDAARMPLRIAGVALVALLAVLVVFNSVLPDIRPENSKVQPPPNGYEYSGWGPVFRVDVAPVPSPDIHAKWLIHDATYGSAIWRWNGSEQTLPKLFPQDPRSWPFEVAGRAVDRQLIIGSAGGHEVLTSLDHGSRHIDAVELNPVTVGIVKDRFRDYTGDWAHNPRVALTQGDGRSFLARSNNKFDLVWFVAPDSYAANNAASSGAFVLSESYLYTKEMVTETLKHLTDDGIAVVQFGEIDFLNRPNRTARYVLTAREAFKDLGIEDPGAHMMIATSQDPLTSGLSTIMLKKTPFTQAEIDRFTKAVPEVAQGQLVYVPGITGTNHVVPWLAAATDAEAAKIQANYPYDISPITDDGPFFWHFVPFTDVVRTITHSIDGADRESAVGERVLLLLLVIATLFAIAFLLVPFLVVRRRWATLPAKGVSAVYFAALGLGFMLYEITMIQRLTLYLGFPTYSLTVTLASLLVFTGLGALLSNRFAADPGRILPVLLFALVALTVFYRLALTPITSATLDAPLFARILVAFALLAPLGLCLGMFMPLGLRTVGALTPFADEYVAWGWAINGVFSVIGSVLTTILSMTFGFRTVQTMAVAAYLVAGVAMWRLLAARRAHDERYRSDEAPGDAEPLERVLTTLEP